MVAGLATGLPADLIFPGFVGALWALRSMDEGGPWARVLQVIAGTATLASAIGGGGLGRLIFSGLSSIRNEIILAGAIPATLLALAADWLLKRAQEYFNPSARAKRLAKRHGISAETESNSAA